MPICIRSVTVPSRTILIFVSGLSSMSVREQERARYRQWKAMGIPFVNAFIQYTERAQSCNIADEIQGLPLKQASCYLFGHISRIVTQCIACPSSGHCRWPNDVQYERPIS